MKYKTLKYKDLVVHLVRRFLSMKMTRDEANTILSGWHYAKNTGKRNIEIEQAMNEIEDILILTFNYSRGAIDQHTFLNQIKERYNE